MDHDEDSGVKLMDWDDALAENYDDYAYGPGGSGIQREEDDGSYTVMSGGIATAGYDWSNVQRTGLSKDEIEQALIELNIPLTGWSYE